MKCFYHSADFDGKCSGAIIKLVWPECEMIGINYGDDFPWESIGQGEKVFMVDYCLQPFRDMRRLNMMSTLIWIDHHKSAIEAANECGFEASGGMVLDTTKAGCELTWEYMFPGSYSPMPMAVRLLGRYDVWQWQDTPKALEFQYGLRCYGRMLPDDHNGHINPLWFILLNKYDCTELREIIQKGESIVEYEKQQNESYIRSYGFEVEFDGLRCIAVNRGMCSSQVFDALYDPAKHDAMLAFCRLRQGGWTVSLYSTKPEVDVSVVAKAHGGGGHKGAAGFQCDIVPFACDKCATRKVLDALR